MKELTDPQKKFEENIFAIRDLRKKKRVEDLSYEILNLFSEDDFISEDARKVFDFYKKKLLDILKIAILNSSSLKTLWKKSFPLHL